MRRSNLLLSLFVLLAPVFAIAQEAPRAEIFGGYSYLHMDTQQLSASTGPACLQIAIVPCPIHTHSGANGWDAAGQFNLNSWLGIKADIAGHYNTPVSVDFNSANALGALNVNVSGPLGSLAPPSHDYFALAIGGGLDIRVARHFLVRAGEFDYQFVKASGGNSGHQNDFRFSTGVVFALGSGVR